MKQGIHPNYHTINVVWTDGSTTQMKSCWGKEGDRLVLDVDPKTHAAWIGGIQIRKTGRIERFNSRFNAFDFTAAGGKKEEQK